MENIIFCGLEQLELKVSICPAKKCCYKTPLGECAFTELTDDDVDVRKIAQINNQQPYKVTAIVKKSTESIRLGLAIDRYCDFIKSSFARKSAWSDTEVVTQGTTEDSQTVNTMDSHVSRVLRKVFGLAQNQQKEFWSEQRFNGWSSRTGSSAYTLNDIRESLAGIKL